MQDDVEMRGRLWSHFGAASGQLGFTIRLVEDSCGRRDQWARQADAQSDIKWRVVQQASSAMTQGLQARNDWGWDKVHSPGTHYTPHQGGVRETHVANRKTLETEEERERRGRNTWVEIVWVGGWMIEKELSVTKKKSLVTFISTSQGTCFPLFWLLAFCGMWREAVEDYKEKHSNFKLIIFSIMRTICYHHIGHTFEGLSFSIS